MAGRLDAHARRVAAVAPVRVAGARGRTPDAPERDVHHVDDPRFPTSAGTVPNASPMSGRDGHHAERRSHRRYTNHVRRRIAATPATERRTMRDRRLLGHGHHRGSHRHRRPRVRLPRGRVRARWPSASTASRTRAWTWRHLLPGWPPPATAPWRPFLRGYAPTDVPDDGLYQTGRDRARRQRAARGARRRRRRRAHRSRLGRAGHLRRRRPRARAVAPGRGRRGAAAAAVAEAFFSYDQLQRSWYMFFFQQPAGGHGGARWTTSRSSIGSGPDWSPGYEAAEDLAHVKDCLRDPANLTAALGYYRATLGGGARVARAATPCEAAGGRRRRRSPRCTSTASTTAAWASSSPTGRAVAPHLGRIADRGASTAPATSSTSRSPTRQPTSSSTSSPPDHAPTAGPTTERCRSPPAGRG